MLEPHKDLLQKEIKDFSSLIDLNNILHGYFIKFITSLWEGEILKFDEI